MPVRFSYHSETPQQPVLERELAACEEYLGARLPPELRAFLRAHDGPRVDPGWICTQQNGQPTWLGPINTFLTIIRSDPRSRRDTIESYTYSSREIQKLPRHFLCIGMMCYQPSTLLISTAEADYGAIYAWHVRFTARFDASTLTALAPSLPALLDSFCEPPASANDIHPNWQQDLQRIRSMPVFPT